MDDDSYYKWYVLILTALTSAFAIGAPAMCLAVLFDEISADLHLTLVQMGLLWSIGSLPAIFTSTLSGAIGDRFGPKRVIMAGTLLLGITAGARGLATDFTSMFLIIIVIGALVPLISMSAFKICGIWFPRQQLGLANGIISMGMSLGLLIGSLLSATVLSPWLGGWRNVLFFYGVLAALLSIPWYFTRPAPKTVEQNDESGIATVPMQQAVAHIVKLKNIWLLGLSLFGMGGCLQSVSGYLSIYLRGQGWSNASADTALSMMSVMSMIFILPLALWSDRLGARKNLLLGTGLIIAIGTGLLSFADGILVWGVVILMGIVRDGSSALFMTMVIETEGVGPVYAGTATGFVMLFMFIGNLLAPPLGNKLAEIAPGVPFLLWAGMAALGIVGLVLTKPARSIRVDQGLNLVETQSEV